jgi:hypothetical protein
MSGKYRIEEDKEIDGYYVTDGIWKSATYPKIYADKVLRDATWGEKGADGRGSYESKRLL